MAERILIHEVDNWCQYRYLASVNHLGIDGSVIANDEEVVCHREDNWGEPCDDKCCEQCTKKEMLGISCQEAIKKISSHLLMCDISTMDNDEIAEAALNALLVE